ncbi:Gp19/Gp15/Gp42 family protein [Actinacidiphila sp. bgisy145]|uniref:Gp19/Gp15/Gp42 family protein n=1 Tax=Actinacidiphila sp. bgisy145 TaxID=3413792 RepID=UPI003EBA6F42
MADFATVDDLAGRLIGRDLTDDERAKAPALLADASAIMREQVPDIDTRQPATAVGVCCAMVLRVVLNPEGKRQQSIDDYSYTTDSARSSGELYLSDQERAQLQPAVGGRAFSIVPGCSP